MDTVLLELQIQVRIGKAAGTPMLGGDNFAWQRLELAPNLATPRAVFEGLMRPGCFLNRSNGLPSLVVAWAVSREALPSARQSGLATYEEHNHWLLQPPSSDPIFCLLRK